jgi:hypothetical protein
MCTTTVPRSDPDAEEYTLPSAEALLAGTLALMTGVAQAPSECARVGAMAAKIVANLGELAEHAALSPSMRLMVTRLMPHWQPLAQAPHRRRVPAAGFDDAERTRWHPAPQVLQ